MLTVYIRLSDMIVMLVFGKVPGQAYSTPAGQAAVEVSRNTYVGAGFTATQNAEGGWTFAPPVVDEEEPPVDPFDGLPLADRIALLRAEKAASDAIFDAKLAAIDS